jgi:uracil permease
MENTTTTNDLVLDVHEKPAKKSQWALLSIQHILAMFVACITVPLIVGTSIPATIISAGVGTLIYILLTQKKSPVVLSSSFAYISSMTTAFALGGGNNYLALAIGMVLVGLIYFIVALVIKKAGTAWLFKLLPTIVVGPVIMVIGLGLAVSAINNLANTASSAANYNLVHIFCGLVALFVTAITAHYGKKTLSLIPFVIGMLAGYAVALVWTGIGYAANWNYAKVINFAPIVDNFTDIKLSSFIGYDCFAFLEWNNGAFEWGQLITIVLAFAPVSLVTICEHIGDHLNLGGVIHKDLLKDPGLDRTLMGDGIATAVSGVLCGCANTTYGENVAVVGVTKVASVSVIITACIATIALGFFTPLMVVVQTIPACVTGGVSLVLYGFIASSGVKMLINEKVDFNKARNIFIAAAILVAGIGGLAIQFKIAGQDVKITSTAVAMILGILLNLILKDKEVKTEEPVAVVAEEPVEEKAE